MSDISKTSNNSNLFSRSNHMIILGACVTIVIGLVLMAGNGSTTSSFEPEIFSTRRIVVAPMICLTGYLSVIVGILWHR